MASLYQRGGRGTFYVSYMDRRGPRRRSMTLQ